MNEKSDSQIQSDVMNELRWEPSVSHEEIGVAVHAGVVTLSGFVPNFAEKLAAEKAAMRVRGVKGIAEEIKVRIQGPHKKGDTEIAEALANALRWHVWTPDNVKAKVEKGWVTLSGEVDYEYQRKSALDSVRFLAGVNGVTNNIMVKPQLDVHIVERTIEEALVRDAGLEAKNIKVTADGGTIRLSGNVHSYFEKQAAGSAAWRASGVNRVENNILVV
jgi:osmotically-inducible protein OsmY